MVIHDNQTDVYLAIRVDNVYLTEEGADDFCAGLDASWRFLN